jgi:hypothetical protein
MQPIAARCAHGLQHQPRALRWPAMQNVTKRWQPLIPGKAHALSASQQINVQHDSEFFLKHLYPLY